MDPPVPPALSTALFLLLAMSAAGVIHVWWLRRATAHWLMQPLDFGRTFRGVRVLGDHKRLRGLLAMPVAAAAAFALLASFREHLPAWLGDGMWAIPVGQYAGLGLAAGLAFMLAELPNSFVKRQLGVPPGAAPVTGGTRLLCFVLDRFDSVLGVLVVVSLLVPVTAAVWFWVLLLGPGLHALFSTALHIFGVKARAL